MRMRRISQFVAVVRSMSIGVLIVATRGTSTSGSRRSQKHGERWTLLVAGAASYNANLKERAHMGGKARGRERNAQFLRIGS